jgi:hypothetical protein
MDRLVAAEKPTEARAELRWAMDIAGRHKSDGNPAGVAAACNRLEGILARIGD